MLKPGGTVAPVDGEAPAPVVYIAATREQAAYALERSGEINDLRATLGLPQESVNVLVLGTDSALTLDALPGAPGTRYFDLRTP